MIRLKAVIFSAVALLMSLSFVLVVFEIWLRYFPPLEIRQGLEAESYFGMMSFDPEIGRVLKPRHSSEVYFHGSSYRVETNSLGFRGPEFNIKKEPGVSRILAIGDSFTFGYGLNNDKTFLNLLSSRLKNSMQKQPEIINSGVPGWGPQQERNFYFKSGRHLDADLVLWFFYENDLLDTYANVWEKKTDILQSWNNNRKPVIPLWSIRDLYELSRYLESKSFLYTFLRIKSSMAEQIYNLAVASFSHRKTVGLALNPDSTQWTVGDQGISVVDEDRRVMNSMTLDRWSLFSLTDNQVKLLVWRENIKGRWDLVASTRLVSVKAGRSTIVIDPVIEAKAGDTLGFFAKNGNIAKNKSGRGKRQYRLGDQNVIDTSICCRDDYGNTSIIAYGEASEDSDRMAAATLSEFVASVSKVLRGGDSTDETASQPERIPKHSPQLVDKTKISDFSAESPQVDFSATTYAHHKTNTSETVNKVMIEASDTLAEVKSDVESRGAEFLVVYLPSYLESLQSTPVMSKEDVLELIMSSKLNVNQPSTALFELWQRRGIKFISLVERFRSHQGEGLFLVDTHYNELGNEIVAQELEGYLLKQTIAKSRYK
jgi:hypothetical protein